MFWCSASCETGVHSPFARAKDPLGVGMAKALLGQRVYLNDRLVMESARLRSRVRDLEMMVQDLKHDNDRLRHDDRLSADLSAEIEATRQPVH
jgi:hypothetical protein